MTFHLSRLEGLAQGMMMPGGDGSQFPVRIQPGWLDGYGYAVSVFYGDIFMYVPAAFRAAGATLEEAYKLYIGIINAATVFCSFYAFKKMTRNEYAATMGSVLYAGSIQRLSVLYKAHLGAAGGMVFFPLILAGFYLLLTEDTEAKEYKQIWILLTWGYTGLLMTHMLSCLIVGVYTVLFCLVMCRRILRPHTLRELLKAAGVTVLLNLWYLVPMIQYMFGEGLMIGSRRIMKEEIGDYYAELADFTQSGKNLYQLFTDESVIGFSILLILFLYIITIPIQQKTREVKYGRVVAVMTLVTVAVCTNLFPVAEIARRSIWFTRFCLMIQYQHRLISVAVAFAVCLATLFFAMGVFGQRTLCFMGVLLCCMVLYQDLQYFGTLSNDEVILDSVDFEKGEREGFYSYTIGNGEYLPKSFSVSELTEEVESDEYLTVDGVQRKGLTFDVFVKNTSLQEGKLLFPILYYTGYCAEDVYSTDKLMTDRGDNGRVAVIIPAQFEGKLQVAFREPILWRMAEVISLLTLITMLFFLCGLYKKMINMKIRKEGSGLSNGD